MSSTVYFASARASLWDYRYSLMGKLEEVLLRLDFAARFQAGEYVAVKTHFGSEGAHRIVRPAFIRKVVDALRAVGAKPFVTDTVRIRGWDYLEVANQNGLNPQSLGCPVILADGLFGCDSIAVPAGPRPGRGAPSPPPSTTPRHGGRLALQGAHPGRLRRGDQEPGHGRRGRPRPQRRLEKARGHLHAAQGKVRSSATSRPASSA